MDPATGEPPGTGFGDQGHVSCFAIWTPVLRAGGSRPDLVANATVLVADMDSFGELNDLFAEFFPVDPPARMTMQVPLPRGLLISIGCVAAVA